MKRKLGFITSRARSVRVVAAIAVRNLVRQFRRNLLLGIGIAVGMCILVVTASFTSGLTDILFNKIMVYMTGHIRVVMDQYTTRRSDAIRDMPRFIAAIKQNVPGIVRIDEDVSAFGRSVGNGKTGLVALVGIAKDSDFYNETQLESGNPKDIFKPDIFPGIIMYKNAARDINVGLNDIVTIRFQTVYGQSQAPKFKIVGLIPSENMFMDVAAFVDMDVLRKMLNLRPEEVLGLNIVTSYPQDSQKIVKVANTLYKALTPGAAGVKAELSLGGARTPADVFALKLENNPAGLKIAIDNLSFLKGDITALARAKDGIVLTEPAARALGASVGSRVRYSYAPKYAPDPVQKDLVVQGIVQPVASFSDSTAFTNEDLFYQTYFWNIPKDPAVVDSGAPLTKVLLPEWELLERSANTDAQTKKELLLGRETWKGAKVDVQTMYETASIIVDFQRGLNTVSIVAVLVLFFVILIGVVNTMRMSIRERTREIGTTRAIGMQRGDVRSVFVIEIVILALAACVAGILLAYGLMALLSSATIDLKDNPFSMFFLNKHLYFLPTAASLIGNLVVIVLAAFLIAFFTARRAAKLRVADALRHFE
jgi:ABC-type lipoprotein release transport system permease subunit